MIHISRSYRWDQEVCHAVIELNHLSDFPSWERCSRSSHVLPVNTSVHLSFALCRSVHLRFANKKTLNYVFLFVLWGRERGPCQIQSSATEMAFDGYLLLCNYTAAPPGPPGGWEALLFWSSEGTRGLSLLTEKHACAEWQLMRERQTWRSVLLPFFFHMSVGQRSNYFLPTTTSTINVF